MRSCPKTQTSPIQFITASREPGDGSAFIIHQPNGPSGGRRSHIELGTFLADGSGKPEQQALLRLIGTLVSVPPYADQGHNS
ncbi:hypothetical protein FV228_03845 [Methylobacterium sp. WL18]|nr:hypothetical protein FV228_03845 [Methylobacterium sp. WL18]